MTRPPCAALVAALFFIFNAHTSVAEPTPEAPAKTPGWGLLLNTNTVPVISVPSSNVRVSLISEFKLALTFPAAGESWFVGATPANENSNLAGDSDNAHFSVGLVMGWIHDRWVFSASYLAYSRDTVEGLSRGTAMGVRLDMGYYWLLHSFVSIGPQVSLRYTHELERDGGATRGVLALMPLFSARYRF